MIGRLSRVTGTPDELHRCEEHLAEIPADLADGEGHGAVTESRHDHVVPPDPDAG
ncbi:hypothetical protein [Ilumatobacter sp.]|uniref:hypothetical protein n=1 Tax=Ilumatobacter sp. TaxID=1967498 RepID=UPI003753AEEA